MPEPRCKPYCENIKPYDGEYRCMRCWRPFNPVGEGFIAVTGVSAAGAVGTMAPEAPKFSMNVVSAMFGEIYAHLEDLERYIKEKNDV